MKANYIFKYLWYNNVMYKFMEEDETIDRIRTWMKSEIKEGELSKERLIKLTSTTEKWAKYAHEHSLWYPVAVYDEDETAVCYISNTKNAIFVVFLDERMFEYVRMFYQKEGNDKMFLFEIQVREYLYEKEESLQDLKCDMIIRFSTEGRLYVKNREIIRKPTVRFAIDEKEAADPVNVSQNWLPQPKFGEYDYLCDYRKIIKEGDLLKTIMPNQQGYGFLFGDEERKN